MSADKRSSAPSDSGGRGAAGDEEDASTVATTFFKEVTILFLGVLVGFLWRAYTDDERVSHEGHVIVVLLLVIFCLGRYIALTRR